MSSDPNPKFGAPGAPPAVREEERGVRLYTYPKIIFIWPSMVAAFVCGIGMLLIRDNTTDPTRDMVVQQGTHYTGAAAEKRLPPPADPMEREIRRFSTPQNIMGVIFLAIFLLNLIIMSFDFPRFTIVGLVLLAAAVGFFLLWLNVYFKLVPPLIRALEAIFATANSGFYFLFGLSILGVFAIIVATRRLDYWVVMRNEILHNHGPFSDLERYPTANLKFDKEIPDILEFLPPLQSGRLIFHFDNGRRPIVLDNVLFIEHKEERLKNLMSRMEVRVATDAEHVN